MGLHHSLRELVDARGPEVLSETEEFRGALDDFLTEEEATLGELNLLVDAVRLGALRRLVDVLDHGAEPSAAVWDAGRGLARDRGTDDPTRSCWALAALGYAIGKVDEPLVHAHRANAGTVAAPGPPPEAVGPSGPSAPGAASPPAAPPPPGRGGTLPDPGAPSGPPPADPPAPPTEVAAAPGRPYEPVPRVIPEERSRSSAWPVVLLALLVVAGVAVGGYFLLQSGDDPATDDPPAAGGGDGRGTADGVLPEETVLVSYAAADRGSRLFSVDTTDGTHDPVADDGDVRLPAVAPERSAFTYLEGGAPGRLLVHDVATGRSEPMFTDGPCLNSLRPGFSPDGTRVALVCSGDDNAVEGLYVADVDGTGAELVVPGSDVRGSPSWVSDTRFVFGRFDPAEPATGPKTLWVHDLDDGSEPRRLPTPPGLQATHADWFEGRGLLFLVSEPGPEEVGEVHLMDTDLASSEVLATGALSHPAFSPDGSSVVAVAPDPADGVERLVVFPVDATSERRYLDGPEDAEVGVPAWGTR